MKYVTVLLLSLSFFRGIVHGSWDLVLSEVYLKGNADWIEISNIGDETFNGTITLSGATTPGTVPESFNVDNLVVTGGQAVVIARYGLGSYDYFQNIGLIGATNSKLTLSATGRDIQLWSQDMLLDQFIIDQATVQSNDTTTSFSKKDKFGPVSLSLAQDSWNVSPGYIASPGFYTVPIIELPVTLDASGSGSNLYSGIDSSIGGDSPSLRTSGSNLESPIQPTCIEDATQLRISEIYFGDENHSPFIELQGLSDFQGQATLSGSLLGLSVTIDINIVQDGFLTISRGDNGLLSGPERIVESALALGYMGGQVIVLGQSGQVLDTVQIPPLGTQNVFYADQNDGCLHAVRGAEKFSPGFDEKFLFYFSGSNSSPLPVIASGAWQSGSCPICPVCSNSAGTNDGNSIGSSLPVTLDASGSGNKQSFKILSLDLTTNPSFQTITIQFYPDLFGASLPTSSTFSSSSAYRLHSTNRTTNNVINGTILPGEIKQFTGNRRFPTTANCIQLLSGIEVLDSYCYNQPTTNSEQLTVNSTNSISTSGSNQLTGLSLPVALDASGSGSNLSLTPQSYSIKITSIDYDPYGTDAGNEKIGFILLSGNSIDLKNLTLKIGTRNIHLSGTLIKGGEQIFKGTFGFPNSSKSGQDIIISLVWQDYVFDSYIYNPEKIQPGEYYVTSILDGDTLRIKYGSSTKSVRLLGIDAPESNKTRYGKIECRGTQSKKYLTDRVKGKTISLKLDPSQGSLDSYDRILGYLYLDGEFINQKMIAQGYAKEYTYNTDYQFRNQFLSAQESAKTEKSGIRDPKLCDQTPLSGDESIIQDVESTISGYINGGLGVKIINLLPNPKGKDEGREYLTLIFYQKNQSESGSSLPNTINLSEGWYLVINETKKKLTGEILLNEEKILTGKFSLPNKASCVAVGYGDMLFDKFCYDLPKENELMGEGKQVLEELTEEDLHVLGQVSLRQIDDSLCIVYSDQTLICKKIPPGKTSIKLKNENKLYKNYISLVEGYLNKDRKMLIQNTKIGEYFSIFKEAKKGLKNGQQKIQIGNARVDVYDLKEQLALKSALPSLQQIHIEIPKILKWYASFSEEFQSRKKL